MTTARLEIVTPADEPIIRSSRFFKAPPTLVFQAWTDPAFLRNWWGPRRLQIVSCDVDLRIGGGYRIVHRAPDGQEFAFSGEYREIDPPNRLTSTFVFEGAPDFWAIETAIFEKVDGGTLVRGTSVYQTIEARDMHVNNGMEPGMIESYDRLDELLAKKQD